MFRRMVLLFKSLGYGKVNGWAEGQLQAKMKFGSPAASRHVSVAAGELRAQGLPDDEAIEQRKPATTSFLTVQQNTI